MSLQFTLESWRGGCMLRWKTPTMPYHATILFESKKEAEHVAKRMQDKLDGRAGPPPPSRRNVVCMSCEARVPTLEALDVAIDLEVARVGYEMGMGPICADCAIARWGVTPEALRR